MSKFKKKLTAFTAMLAFLSVSGAATFAMPGDVISNTSNTNIINNGNRTDVNITSGAHGAVGQVDWKDFSVGANEHVNFGFSGLSQTIINRVLGGNASQIMGKLTNSCINDGSCTSYASTSKVILINPAGIMFGAGSQVDLNSFTASTFDFKGAKNLKDLSEAEQAAYLSSLRDGVAKDSKGNNYNFNSKLNFDSNYTEAFDAAGVKYDAGKTNIVLDGTTFTHFNTDGSIADFNRNKSIAIVSDNISYKDSLLRTGDNNNYSGPKSMSNVKLITADGVSFGYLANGYIDNYKVAEDTKTDVVRNITMDNSGLTANGQDSIRSGEVHIVNQSKADGSNIKIANSIVKGVKLLNKENGDIMIVGSKNVDIDNTRLETVNTTVTANDVSTSTNTQNGGEVFVQAGKDLTIKNSLIKTAGAKEGTANAANAGAVRLYAQDGNATVDNSKVIAKNYVTVASTDKTTVNNSLIQSSNKTLAPDSKTNIKISGVRDGVEIHNTVLDATGDVNVISAYTDGTVAGNIVISSDLDANGQNQTVINAGDKLSIQGANTRIDNGSLFYDEIHFYNDGTSGLNNVTVANNSTFSPRTESGSVTRNVTLETNGDFTLENATMQVASRKLTFGTNDNPVDNITFNLELTPVDANNLSVTSTQGNVNAIASTNVHTTGNINLTSETKNVNVDSSKLNADKDVNLTAKKGALNIKNESNVLAGNDANLTAYETITFGKKGEQNNIDNSVKIAAAANINVTSTAGDINAEKTTMPTLTYGERLKFDAKGSNNFTSEDSLKSVNVDYVAGESNNFTTKGDIQFTNSSLKSKSNNITTTEEGGDVILNNLTIKVATADAKDTVTKINAKGNITTKDVTKTVEKDTNATVHTFPQSVNYEEGTAKDGILDVNQTKFIAKTKVEAATPKNNTNGSIILDVKNANNKEAGIELTAENYKWDAQVDANEGPEVHINAVDDELAVSRIVTDKLFTDANDKMYAAPVALTPEELAGLPEGTPSKGYIEVRDYMGFNQDSDFNTDPSDFDYTGDYVPGKVTLPDGEIDVDKKHTINFGDTNEDFILVYDRPVGECPEVPDITPDDTPIDEQPVIVDADSLINQIKLPREQVEISKTSKVSDNTVDQTSNIMSAAAKVDLGQESEANDDEDEVQE